MGMHLHPISEQKSYVIYKYRRRLEFTSSSQAYRKQSIEASRVKRRQKDKTDYHTLSNVEHAAVNGITKRLTLYYGKHSLEITCWEALFTKAVGLKALSLLFTE